MPNYKYICKGGAFLSPYPHKPFLAIGLILFLAFFALTTKTAHAANTYYVSTTGNDNSSGSLSQPFRTISAAYSKTLPGDTIIVKAGTYTDYTSSYSGLTLDHSGTASQPITLRSEIKGQAVLDAQGNLNRAQVLSFYGSYNVVDGFVITNGHEGGVLMTGFNNRLINNEISYNGANGDLASSNGHDGVFSDHDSGRNEYIGNYVHHNGRFNLASNNLDHGMYLCGDDEIIVNNIITNNVVMGLQIAGYTTVSNMHVYNNTIANNGGDGIKVWQSLANIEIKNNILLSNGGYGIGSYNAHGTGVVIDHNDIFGNYGNFNPSDLSDFTYTYTNTLTSNPLLVSGTNFHLQPTSPAINSGITLSSVMTDFEGNSRPFGSAYDIGAYEYSTSQTPSPLPPPPPPPTNTQYISQSQMQIVSASDNMAEAPLILDGNINTQWLAQNFPQETVINLGGNYSVSSFTYQALPGWTAVKSYEAYVSPDNSIWTLAASGNMPADGVVSFSAKTGRYLKLKYLNNINGGTYAYTGEINIVGTTVTAAIAGDLNLDHIVNSLDWSIMNSKWFTSDANADLNKDGIVNAIDFSILNSNWFKTW